MDKVDLLLCPTLPFAATPVGAMTVVIENGIEQDLLSAITQYTGVPSLSGLPALAVPCGFDPDGLPVAMHLIGKPFAEATLFRLGAADQALTDFHHKAPPI